MTQSSPKSNAPSSIARAVRLAPALLLGSALALVSACDEAVEDEDPITITGSSTVYPFAEAIAAQTVSANPDLAQPFIESTGTKEGISAFCTGTGPETIDIANASRRMSLAEFEECEANGVDEIIEVKVGRDGIAFASAIEEGLDFELTRERLYRALALLPYGDEQTNSLWSDIDADLPEAPILVYGPPASSGTRDALADTIMLPACMKDASMVELADSNPEGFSRYCKTLRSDAAYIDQGEKDDLIVRKVANNPRAIGVFGYSYLEENDESVKALPVNGILPTAATIGDGSYPASRPLYIYVKKAHIGEVPGIEAYLDQWAQSWSVGGPLTEIGLVPATEEIQAKSAAAVNELTVLSADDFSVAVDEG